MSEIKNCAGETYPVFATGKVNGCSIVQSAVPYGSVWYLKVNVSGINGGNAIAPVPGQFYMLRSVRSGLLLGRPISVYNSRKFLTAMLALNF